MESMCIKPEAIANEANVQRSIAVKMESLITSIENIQKSFIGIPGYQDIQKSLADIVNELKEEQKDLRDMGDTLEAIVRDYVQTEARIIAISIEEREKKRKEESKKDWWDYLNDFRKKILRVAKEINSIYLDIAELGINLTMGITEIIQKKVTEKADIDDALNEWLLGFVQQHIRDESVLGIFSLLAGINSISNETVKEHLESNSKAWKLYQEKYRKDIFIEKQPELSDFQYGVSHDKLSELLLNGEPLNGSVNTCEVIAVYNALVDLNGGVSSESFPKLLEKFEKAGIMLDGYLGTAPEMMEAYFQANSYETKMLSGKNLTASKISELQENYETYIVTTYNERDNIMGQIHTMSITLEKGKYVMHNDYNGTQEYNTLKEAIYGYNEREGEPICIIGIR